MTATLYRFYNADDQLLYVGITEHGAMRWQAHRKDKPWWPDVAKVTTEHHPDRAAALEAERAAIVAEKPLHNVVHNRGASKPVQRPPAAKVDVGAAWPFMLCCLKADDVVAIRTWSDAYPVVGRIDSIDPFGLRVDLYSFSSCTFGYAVRSVLWNDVISALHANVEETLPDGTRIYNMDPLADFQREHDTRRDVA